MSQTVSPASTRTSCPMIGSLASGPEVLNSFGSTAVTCAPAALSMGTGAAGAGGTVLAVAELVAAGAGLGVDSMTFGAAEVADAVASIGGTAVEPCGFVPL